jgi:hypothetical protein
MRNAITYTYSHANFNSAAYSHTEGYADTESSPIATPAPESVG